MTPGHLASGNSGPKPGPSAGGPTRLTNGPGDGRFNYVLHPPECSGQLAKRSLKCLPHPRSLQDLNLVAAILTVAASYCISGKLGLLLAIPPGYATGVWPPSGIALACVLLFGYRVWPGVVLGSFCVNIGTSLDTSTTASLLKATSLATGIGLGAALQAVVGAFLIRRSIGFPTALDRESTIARFLGYGGPLSCAINATVGTTALLAAGTVTLDAYASHWWTWWLGDTIGVFIFAPLVLIFTASPGQVWRRRPPLGRAPTWHYLRDLRDPFRPG